MYNIVDNTIVEFQRRMQENRDRYEAAVSRGVSETTQPRWLMGGGGGYKPRTAARDIANRLLQSGRSTPRVISDILGIPLSEVLDEERLIIETDLVKQRQRRKPRQMTLQKQLAVLRGGPI